MSTSETPLKRLITFHKVDIRSTDTLKPILSVYQPYSDFNLLSLLCWDTQNINSYALYKGNLVVKIKDYLEDKFIYSFLGSNEVQEIAEYLLSITTELKLVPETVAQQLNPDIFVIEEDETSADYILNTKDLAELTGGKYKSIRRQIRKFSEAYPLPEVKELDLSNSIAVKEIKTLTKKWCLNKRFDDQKIEEDVSSINKFIELTPHFSTFALGVYVKGVLVAFNFNELLENNWAMGHFGKALNSYEGCSVFLEHKTSEWLQQRGYRYINIQQDAGLTGLKEQKMTLHPEFFLKKYTVKLR